MLIFLVGGARSGKSALAVRIATDHARAGLDVTYVATSPRIAGDRDLDDRIEAHRLERPSTWSTIEEPHEIADVVSRAGTSCVVVVDCLTLWVNNLVWRGDDDAAVESAADLAASAAAARTAPTIVISNEVGLGVHPNTAVGRRYRDLLGRVNQTWAGRADRALFCVAGRAIALHDPVALL